MFDTSHHRVLASTARWSLLLAAVAGAGPIVGVVRAFEEGLVPLGFAVGWMCFSVLSAGALMSFGLGLLRARGGRDEELARAFSSLGIHFRVQFIAVVILAAPFALLMTCALAAA